MSTQTLVLTQSAPFAAKYDGTPMIGRPFKAGEMLRRVTITERDGSAHEGLVPCYVLALIDFRLNGDDQLVTRTAYLWHGADEMIERVSGLGDGAGLTIVGLTNGAKTYRNNGGTWVCGTSRISTAKLVATIRRTERLICYKVQA